MAHIAYSVTVIEIEVPHCSLTYSVAPCTASLTSSPPTGTRKCFNSLGTCQDRPHFTDAPITLTFSEDLQLYTKISTYGSGQPILDENGLELRDQNGQVIYDGQPTTNKLTYYTNRNIFPFIKTIDFSPSIVSLGGDLGQRATLKVTFKDARHSDTGSNFDKYPADRDYSNPYERGTFWGKFRARNPFLRGRLMHMHNVGLDKDISELETDSRHFIIDSIDGPDANGNFSITAKDLIKLADGDRSVAPPISNGFLSAGINSAAGTLTLAPSGIGDAEYPASGYAAIGGKEIVSFTRSSDTLTITRAQLNTTAQDHSAQDRVQIVLRYAAQDPADIISDLLQSYAGVSSIYIPLGDWQAETAGFLGTVYTLNICEPTPVSDLISELITQMGAALWWDDLDEIIRLQILRSISTTAQRYNEDNVLADTLDIREQPEKRISRVIVYFGQINPLLKLDETSNYRSTESQVSIQSEADEGSAAIKRIFARGIAQGGRTVATRIAQKHLSRYVRPPRRFNFELPRYVGEDPHLGIGARLGGGSPKVESWLFQDDTGARVDIPIQITRHSVTVDRHIVEAEEMLFTQFSEDEIDTTNKTIVFDANENNINLRTRHDEIFSAPSLGDTITCIIANGTIIGSSAIDVPSFEIGDWPVGSPAITINIKVRGRLEGAGGAGGSFVNGHFTAASAGGTALYTRQQINIFLNEGSGAIWGGGGGGAVKQSAIPGLAWAGGGGGGGLLAGAGGSGSQTELNGQSGTTESGGLGGNFSGVIGGSGGNPGLDGQTTADGSGGAAGAAIDGDSFITYTGAGDIRGSQIN